ncbi:MAG: hypothetical protein ACRCT7_12180 [Shewanella sp.]
MKFAIMLTAAALSAPLTVVANESPWQLVYAIGVHDLIVDQADSDTLGVNGYFGFSRTLQQSIVFSGKIHVYLDKDTDKLDPDHIPLWFSSDYLLTGELLSLSTHNALDWWLTLDGRCNTVSSVETQLRLFPGLAWRYQTEWLRTELGIGAGYYSLEIDDDVPKTRGYQRGEFDHDTLAYTAKFATAWAITPKLDVSVSAQQWRTADLNLENQYKLKVSYNNALSNQESNQGHVLSLAIEHQQYNLDPYAKMATNAAGYVPILPWDQDTLVRLTLEMPW